MLTTENRGLSAARNHGIGNSSGEHILVLDSDDRFRPEFLERAVAIMDAKSEVGIVGAWAQTYGDYGYVIKYAGGGAADALLRSQCAASSLEDNRGPRRSRGIVSSDAEHH